MPSLTIKPGSRVRLKGQSEYVPDFLVIRCEASQCWIRQNTWNPEALLSVRFTQIEIPEASQFSPSPPPDNVIDMAQYRRKKAQVEAD